MVAALAKPASHGEAVNAGEHNVENHGVEGMVERQVERFAAGRGDGYGVALLGQALAQQLGHFGFVLDHQKLHISSVLAPSREPLHYCRGSDCDVIGCEILQMLTNPSK